MLIRYNILRQTWRTRSSIIPRQTLRGERSSHTPVIYYDDWITHSFTPLTPTPITPIAPLLHEDRDDHDDHGPITKLDLTTHPSEHGPIYNIDMCFADIWDSLAFVE